MTVAAPPRSPRPSDPVERDELEALVNALIEEARQRQRRRRRRYAAAAALAGLAAVVAVTVAQHTTASHDIASASSVTSIASAGESTSPSSLPSRRMESDTPAEAQPVCAECGVESPPDAAGWRAYLDDDDQAVTFCAHPQRAAGAGQVTPRSPPEKVPPARRCPQPRRQHPVSRP